MVPSMGKAISKVKEPQAGLYAGAEAQRVPLRGVRVRARVEGLWSRVTVEQVYRNEEKIPVEAVYIFPLPEGAAVDRVVFKVGEMRIVAKVLEREEAFAAYDDALADGHGAVLVDQERPNVFTASIGNLLPDQEVTVEVSYAAEMAWEGDSVRFLLPTTVAPRYAPEKDRVGVSPTPAESVSPPLALAVPYGLDLRLEAEFPETLRRAESPSHPVRVEMDGRRATISLSAEDAALDRDFVLLLTPTEARFPWVRVERTGDGKTAAAMTLVPKLEPTSGKGTEVIFLVDRSGSMEGSSMEQVRRALQFSLRSLKEGDSLDIVGFGSTFSPLFKTARPYTQDALEAASRHVEGLRADLGGTDLLPALQSVLQRPLKEGLHREVILLTDGEVSNEDEILDLAARCAGKARIFVFGIGFGPSEFLVRGLARATGGTAEFIHPGERIEPKVLRQFVRLAQPAVTDVQLRWEGASVRLQAPTEPPALFDCEPFAAYAIWEGKKPRRVTVSGMVSGQEISWDVDVPVAEPSSEALVAPLAARALIRELEEGHIRRGSSRSERTQGRNEKEILELALAHNLVSSRTSMVAVEEREADPARKPAELRRVPVALTYGWGGEDMARGIAFDSGVRFSRSSADPNVDAMRCMVMQTPTYIRKGAVSEPEELCCLKEDSAYRPGPQPRTGRPIRTAKTSILKRWLSRSSADHPSQQDSLDALVSFQNADGSWHLDRTLCDALGVKLSALKTLAKEMKGTEAEIAVATAAALAWLKLHAMDREVEWKLLALKAEMWLDAFLAKIVPPWEREALVGRLILLIPNKP